MDVLDRDESRPEDGARKSGGCGTGPGGTLITLYRPPPPPHRPLYRPRTAAEGFTSEDDLDLLEARPPVVTVMGHVDHGKVCTGGLRWCGGVGCGEVGAVRSRRCVREGVSRVWPTMPSCVRQRAYPVLNLC